MYPGNIFPVLLICFLFSLPALIYIFRWTFDLPRFIYCPRCGFGVRNVIPTDDNTYFVHSEGKVCKVENKAGEEAEGIGDS